MMPYSVQACCGRDVETGGASSLATPFLHVNFYHGLADAWGAFQGAVGRHDGILQLEVSVVFGLWVGLNDHYTVMGLDGCELCYLLLQLFQCCRLVITGQLSVGINSDSHDVAVQDVGYLLLFLWRRW